MTSTKLHTTALMSTLVVGVLASCGGSGPVATEPTTTSPTTPSSTVANTQTDPAVEFCEAAGGEVFGTEPMCGLPDGTSIDAWEYYRSQVNAGPSATSASATPSSAPETPTPTATPAGPEDTLAALATSIGASSYSDIVEAPNGDFALLVLDDRITLFKWDESAWADVSDMLGPDGPKVPLRVTTVDATGDGVMEFLVTYDDPDQSYEIGAVFYPTCGEFGDGGYGCEWSWAAFTSLEDDYLANEYPSYLQYLRWEDGQLRATQYQYKGNDPNAVVTYDAVEDVWWVNWPDSSSGTTATDCGGGYSYDDQLPIAICSQGNSVAMLQRALGLGDDGYFGPGTETAVRDFQSAAGLPVTGVVDAATWNAVGAQDGPGNDLNGDGAVDGSEVVYD